ncbi:hypothetical protein CIRG_03426 [Coccidioides immitis RMSCC 2394]|uniref:AMP-dependent synthetase/ligase domain-containing protein n=1 Tax=Coccidioides immitis RMSCC 2394 TaxID=404692 RepID=A0A0J6Y9N1_COCIT|nr:hypothetical protein CIRG_03426 [Coccidioides immitis RMSCC 2394]
MASSESLISKLDSLLAQLLADWDIYTTGLATLLVTYVGYVTFFSKDPDAHPFMLARQAAEAPIRQPGESATLRVLDAPHGYPLKAGLGVRDPETPKWSYGRNGDLRDIWRSAVKGSLNQDGTPKGKRGKIYTVLGKNVEERSIDEISKEINVLGQYIRDSKAQNVAICLSDSVELLATLFAGAFYGFKITIIPHNLASEELATYLQQAKADLLVAEAGAVDLDVVSKARTSLNNVVWVTKVGNQHLDWSQGPDELGSQIKVAVWQDLVKDSGNSATSELPASDPNVATPSITTLWFPPTGPGSFVEYTAANLISAVGALGSSLPRNELLRDSDLFLSIDSLSHTYSLCWTLAALYANASVALNSVAGEVVDLALATAGISPTVLVASSHTISDYHAQRMGPSMDPITNIGRYFQSRSLDSGVMPTRNWLWNLSSAAPTAGLSLDKLRLLFISHRADGNKQNRLTSDQLTDLRIFTGARVVYALTAQNVAGAVCQTLPYDYRTDTGPSHFGPPTNSVEIKLIGCQENGTDERATEGEIFVTGPSVVSGQSSLGVKARIRDDNTITLCD